MGSLEVLLCSLSLLVAIGSSSAQHIPLTFPYGVASGDPLPDRIMLWTAVVPEFVNNPYVTYKGQYPYFPLNWTVYTDKALTQVAQSGVVNSTADTGFTSKVDVGGLKSGIQYYYNFFSPNGSITSDTGTFRLPQPAGTHQESFKYMIFSCSNWPNGYFNVYDAASRYDLDAWFHVGDWIYEYGIATDSVRYQNPPAGLQPSDDIQTLDDYRQRHALYRQDPGLRAISASAAVIAIWDDHEFTNNVFADGAEDQHPGEVDFLRRKQNAAQAYYEWIPIRPVNGDTFPANLAINRTFPIGDLATLFMLEDRVSARTDAGQDCLDGSPTCIPYSPTYLAQVVGTTPPSKWNATQIQQIQTFKSMVDSRRTDPAQIQLGAPQLQWIQSSTNTSVGAKVPWQLYFEGTVMQDWFWADYEAAIAAEADAATAQYWSDILRNVTEIGVAGNATFTSYSLAPKNMQIYGKPQPVTATVQAGARGSLAAGRYKVNPDEDSWQGYLAERQKFYEAIEGANNAVVYSGDSHNFWTGYLTNIDYTLYRSTAGVPENALDSIIGVEFAGGSVTSGGNEGDGTFPFDLVNAAFVAANNGSMVHCENRYKGSMYGQLTHGNLHMEYIYVNTIATTDYTAFCGAAFDVASSNSTTGQPDIVPGVCGPVPATLPYAARQNQQDTRVLMPAGDLSIPLGTANRAAAAGPIPTPTSTAG